VTPGGKDEKVVTLTFKDVTEILKLIDTCSCQEVIIEVEGLKLAVRKGKPATDQPALLPGRSDGSASTASPFGGRPLQSSASEGPFPVAKRRRAASVEGIEVRASMVGTFYRRPSPEEDPFVTVGSRVKKGDPLGLIEVMKLHTSIPSPGDGIVASIDAEDGKPVEFDQLLFVISPA
jgi:acetyl-CoA carboxylase biotin carboxyl carrier protein